MLLKVYNEQIQEDIARINSAASQKDEHSIRIAAHRIVSASRTLGLHDNAQAAQQIEACESSQTSVDWGLFNKLITKNLGTIKKSCPQC